MNNLAKRITTAVILGPIFLGIMLFAPAIIFSYLLALILAAILIFEWPKLFPNNFLLATLISPIYPILPFILLIILNQSGPDYRPVIFLIFFAVFAFDSGSYFAGNLFGKTKILPQVSPGKSWEGFIGGASSCYLTVLIFFNYSKIINLFKFSHQNLQPKLLLISLIISILALIGDLFESYLKRRVNLKDSGDILPGHGGLLDRFDAVMFVAYLIIFLKFI